MRELPNHAAHLPPSPRRFQPMLTSTDTMNSALPVNHEAYIPPSSWTPINRPMTHHTSSTQSHNSQITQQATALPLTVTPPPSSRTRRRGRKRNLDADLGKADEITEKKTRSSANKKRSKETAASKAGNTVEIACATKIIGPDDPSNHVASNIDDNTSLKTISFVTPQFEQTSSADISNSTSVPKLRGRTKKKTRLPSATESIDHHAPQSQLKFDSSTKPNRAPDPSANVKPIATLTGIEGSRSDIADSFVEFDEIFNSLPNDTFNSLPDEPFTSTNTCSNSRACLHPTQHSSSTWPNQTLAIEDSDSEDTARIPSSCTTFGPNFQLASTDVEPETITHPVNPKQSEMHHCLRKFVSPVTPKTKFLEIGASVDPGRKPIVRSPFPSPVSNRSPIIGLSPNLLLRTCFRIGEAINQASHASKSKQKVIFELYARVLSSERDDSKQDFVFCDLFHEKLPHLRGTYSASLWKHVDLYDYDSRRLLNEKRMCRCIGEIKREDKEWVMTVFNIWEATWEDVEWVEGIINS